MKNYHIYIITNYTKTTLYIGITNDLVRRMSEHKNELIDGFSKKYKLNHLVYFERTNDVLSAIEREKHLKKWNRKWKNELIEKANPTWRDLSDEAEE